MDEREDRKESDRDDNDRNGGDGAIDGPRPDPGLTAPLDDLTEEEKKSGPMGMMPGAGPEPDEIRHSGVEEQEEREDEKEKDDG